MPLAQPPLDLLPVFNAQPGATLLLSPEWVIVGASDDYLAATLTEREALVGQYIFDAFPDNPATPEANGVANVRASLEQVLATGQPHEMAPQHYDVPDPAHPGRFVERHWQPRHTPVLDAAGQVQFIIQSVQDITARRLAERQLRDSQDAERAARAETTLQRQQLYHVLEQAPAMICIFDGPAHVFQFVNPPYQALVGDRPLVGKPIAEAMPELAGQPVFGLLDRVYQTGETFHAHEMLVQLDHGNEDRPELEKRYYNFIYQARRDLRGAIDGILVFAYEVTSQVLARQQVQTLNEELAAANEELQATNDEFLASNAALSQAQQQVQHANDALTAAVATAEAARVDAEAQRQRFYDVLQQLPAQVAVYRGPAHVFSFVNARFSSYVEPGTLLGLPVREASRGAVGEDVFRRLDRVYATGEPAELHELEVALDVHTPGTAEAVYLNAFYLPLRDARGRVDGVLDFSYDVTEQVRARRQVEQLNQELEARVQDRTRELADQQRLLGQILAQVPAAITTLHGPEHRFTFANDRYQRLVGSRVQTGQTVVETLPEVVEQGFIELLDNVYRTGQTFEGKEIAIMLAPPNQPPVQHYLDFTYQPMPDEHGQPQGILAFVVDVTEQVRARQQTDALQAQLLATARQQAQEREAFHYVFEQTPALVALLRAPGHRFEYVNPAYQALFPGRQLVGRDMVEAAPETREQGFVALLDRVYQTGDTYYGLDLPFVTVPPDGGPAHTTYFNFTYQAYRENGQIAGISIFAFDVTEQVRAGQRVQDLNEELAAINEELQATNEELHESNTQLLRTNADLDTFVYAASHDLKAPITNIEGLLDALREYLPAREQEPMVPRLVGMMEGAIQRFQQTIAHLADVTRLQHRSEPLTSDVDVPGILEDVRLDVLPLLESTQTQLVLDVPTCPGVRVPAKHLRSILFNLLSNAVKYRAPDRAPVVQVRAQCAAGRFVLEVEDNGLGLSEAQQGYLFTMFKRLHTHVEGSGVGLYLIKRMIDLAGGTITVASQPGVGSTFTVTLPGA